MASISRLSTKVTGQPIFTFGGGSTAVPLSVAIVVVQLNPARVPGQYRERAVIYDRLDNVFAIDRRITYSVSGIDHYAWCIALSSGSRSFQCRDRVVCVRI